MAQSLQVLEEKREELYRELASLGDLRRGTISVNYRRCGKRNCACARADHPGHGPQYLWNATIEGKSRARNLPLGPELEKVGKEAENYRRFRELSGQLVEINEEICRRRPVAKVEDEKELQALKKKLRKKFARKRIRK